jgi:YD repeat-containing protein
MRAIINEPENRFSLPSFKSNKYYAWGISYNENCPGNRNRNIVSLEFDFSDKGIVSNTSAKELGCFSNLGGYDLYSLSYLEPYDLLEYYKNTNFENLPEWYIDASITPWGVKRKIRDRIDNNMESVLPNWHNTDNYNISQYSSWQNEHDGMIWTSRITPNELLYEKLDNLYPDYDQTMYENPLYSNIGIDKNDIIVFDKELGYVFDAQTALLKTIFDNPTKQIIRTYEHDSNLRLISIKDKFDNKIEIIRDYEGNPTSITAPNGQMTRLFVNYKGDLTSITYEDNSAYLFDYDDNSLLTSKRSPNSNYVSYYYDDKGRVVKEIDSNNGVWQFNKVSSSKAAEYNIIRPQGDKLTYIDTREFDKTLTSLIKLPSGYSYSTLFDEKKTLSNTIKDSVQTITKTDKDPLTLNTILKSQTIKLPSGLTKSITNEISYAGDISNLQSKTQKLTINQKPVTIKNDYVQGTVTIISANNIKEVLTYDKTTSLPVKYQYANLEPVTYNYDSQVRLAKLSQNQNTFNYSYNHKGNVQTVKDAI